MNGYIATTDYGWYQFLRARPEIGEVNFWSPGGTRFGVLQPGEPFFFKLKAPHDAIGGFGMFSRFSRLPVWRAWEVFGERMASRTRLNCATGLPDWRTTPGCDMTAIA